MRGIPRQFAALTAGLRIHHQDAMCKLVGDQQGKWNATFGWRVITFSVIDFAHEHRASKEHRDRPDLRRARGRRGPGGPNAISPSDVSPATTQ